MEWIDILHTQRGNLTSPETRVGSAEHEGPVVVADRVGQSSDLLRCEDLELVAGTLPDDLGTLHIRDRVAVDDPCLHRVLHDRSEDSEHVAGGTGCYVHLGDESFDRGSVDAGDWHVPERRQDMRLQDALVARSGSRLQPCGRLEPIGSHYSQQRLPESRVEILAAILRTLHRPDVATRIAFRPEVLRVLLAIGRIPTRLPPTVPPLADTPHGPRLLSGAARRRRRTVADRRGQTKGRNRAERVQDSASALVDDRVTSRR